MANFISDFMTYSTASALAAATWVQGLPAAYPPTDQIASIRPEISMIHDIAAQQGIDPRPSRTAYAVIPMADLVPVVFNPDGTEVRNEISVFVPRPLTGAVTASAVNIRSGPGTSNAVIARGLRGQIFTVTGTRDGSWLEIRGGALPGTAWVHGDYFKVNG